VVQAKLVHVDAEKGRIFLSIRQATPNPLLETLDNLTSMGQQRGRSPGGGWSGGSGGEAGGNGGREGDLDAAVQFCAALLARAGAEVASASLGPRMLSRAGSQQLEVYLAKGSEGGREGGLEGPGDGRASGAAGSEGGGGDAAARTYTLVIRKGREVQEVSVVSSLSRSEMRRVLNEVAAALGSEEGEA
jgi:hypothetical protein